MEGRGRIEMTGYTVVNMVRKHFEFLACLKQIIVYKCHSHLKKADLPSLAQTSTVYVNHSSSILVWNSEFGL